MAAEQVRPIAPPDKSDKDFSDFSENIQFNLAELFEQMPDVRLGASVPGSNEGSIKSIRLVQVSGSWRLYIKVDDTTWKYVALA